jgi:hypothetical protein
MKNFPAPGIGALTLDVSYDPAVISVAGCHEDPTSQFNTALCNANYAPNTIRLTYLSMAGVSGEHLLASLAFTATGSAGDSTPITLTVQTATNPGGQNLTSVGAENGEVTLAVRPGDVNCDQKVNTTDALFILQYDIGLRNPGVTCPPQAGTLYLPACDVNNDTQCNSVDALMIMQCEVGISNTLCPIAAMGMQATSLMQSANIMVGEAETTTNGQVSIPVSADVTDTALGASTLDLSYDATLFQPVACQVDPDAKFDMELCNLDYADGTVRFSLVSVNGVSGGMKLANITFRAIGEPGSSSHLTITAPTFNNTDGQAIPTTLNDGKLTIRDLHIYLPITK